MSEKRFVQVGDTSIKDTLTGEKYYAPCEDGLLDLLNEQQATIQFLQDEIDELKKDIDIYEYEEKKHSETARKLYEENEQLQAQLREKEQDEQLYANEIVKLNKEAKEVLDFKSLGGDY